MINSSWFSTMLNSKKTYFILILLNIIVGFVIFKLSTTIRFPDSTDYWYLGESLIHGKFSSWYFLPKYYPETLRTPGYPLFLSFFQLFSDSQLIPEMVQLFIYGICIFLCLQIIKKISNSQSTINLFLLLLLPNIQVVYYTGCISAEILNVLFVLLTIYLITCNRGILNSILLALFTYGAFIVRPSFLLFPFVLFVYFLIVNKRDFKYASTFIVAYILLLIPFGIWNKTNHGLFKVTPLEGGAGVAHMGFWQLKLPDGYWESFYFGNVMVPDLTKPPLYTKEELADNVKKFESEAAVLTAKQNVFLAREDSAYLAYMSTQRLGLILTHNSRYTIEREKIIWKEVIENVKEEPGYYLISRCYHLFKAYVTGINYITLAQTHSILGKIKLIYPFVVTLIFIFCGLLYITISTILSKKYFPYQWILILLCWYYGVVHLPFTMQSRYTIPVHLLILVLLSLMISKKIKTHNE